LPNEIPTNVSHVLSEDGSVITFTVTSDVYVNNFSIPLFATNGDVTSNTIPIAIDLAPTEVSLNVVDGTNTLEKVGDFIEIQRSVIHPNGDTV
jgi:hypothetical protein